MERVDEATVRHLALGEIGYMDSHGNPVGEDGKPLPKMRDLAADLLDAREQIKAWGRLMEAVRGFALENMGRIGFSVADDELVSAWIALPEKHRPQPEWRPSESDLAMVAEQVRKFSVGGSTGIAEQVLAALHSAGRLK